VACGKVKPTYLAGKATMISVYFLQLRMSLYHPCSAERQENPEP